MCITNTRTLKSNKVIKIIRYLITRYYKVLRCFKNQNYFTDAVKKYASEKTNIPVARISSDAVRQLIMSQFGNSNPILLALLAQDRDSTQTTSEYLKQVMLSSIGM